MHLSLGGLSLLISLCVFSRLTQAKEEAEREVAQYRAQREAEFRKKLSDTSGDSSANVKRLEAETDEKIKR